MNLPMFKGKASNPVRQQISFGGLNHTEGAADGALWDMRNLTSDYAPVLASRKPRKKIMQLDDAGGLFSWNGLCYVDGTEFYYDGVLRGSVSAGVKQFAAVGDIIVIFPDKKYYDTVSEEFGNLEAQWVGNEVFFGNGMLGEQAGKGNLIRATGVDWSEYFRAGDAVSISGCRERTANNKTVIIREIAGDELRFYDNAFSVGDAGYSEFGRIAIWRKLPELRNIFEHENRLWGCDGHTIYASKLGDVRNFYVYDGLSTDSYAVDTGSAGTFTAAISYQGYPIFFKEDMLYKVYGNIPSDFEVVGSSTIGIPAQCAGSLAVAGEQLMFVSRLGVMAYTGGVPQSVGAALGTESIRQAIGGSDGRKYYLSAQRSSGWELLVLDMRTGQWHKEDASHAVSFCRHGGNLLMQETGGGVWVVSEGAEVGEYLEAEKDVRWMAEFADFAEQYASQRYGVSSDNAAHKGLSKILLRMELGEGAQMRIETMYDSSGVWKVDANIQNSGAKRSYNIPLNAKRADHYRIRLSGCGSVKIYSMAREYIQGSDR